MRNPFIDFIEVDNDFINVGLNPLIGDFKPFTFGHEKEIHDAGDVLVCIVDRPIGTYSPLEFISHRIAEIIFPGQLPHLYQAIFKTNPIFMTEKIPLDIGHICFNYNLYKPKEFTGMYSEIKNFSQGTINQLAKQHEIRVLQALGNREFDEQGIKLTNNEQDITFDDEGIPIHLEILRATPNYFNIEAVKDYVLRTDFSPMKTDALNYYLRLWDKYSRRFQSV